MKEGIAASGKTKAEHYSWAEINKRGREKDISIDELLIDNSYQRDEVSELQTLWRARNFDIDLCGRLLVSLRATTGQYYVVDGQQRLLAAKRRGDVKHLPCLVRNCANIEEEAQLFFDANCGRASVKSWHKWRAGLLASIPKYTAANEIAKKAGLRVVKDGDKEGTLTCPSVLVYYCSSRPDLVPIALRNAKTICSGRSATVEVLKGVIGLLRQGVCVDDHAQRLADKGGVGFINQNINQVTIASGNKGHSENMCALGMLQAINKHLRKKIIIA